MFQTEKMRKKILPLNVFGVLALYALAGTTIFYLFRVRYFYKADTFDSVGVFQSCISFDQNPLIATGVTSQEFLGDTADGIEWNDSIFSRRGWDNDPIVIESHKLLFFTIPKNACSTFKKLFRRMMGHPNWLTGNPHNPATNGLRYLGHYSREQQKEFMTSPDWTRAVFVRDPLERALSAYMDKGLKTGPKAWQPPVEGAHLKRHCCQTTTSAINPACRRFPLSPFEAGLTKDNFPFELFVTSFMRQCKDEHWKQQSLRMQMENWKWINFVGHFENKQNDTRRLLERIGGYDEFGSFGWGESSTDLNKNKTLSIFEKNIANHKTGSGSKMDDHYSSKSERLVLQYYRLDYSSELFNITKPVDYAQKLFGRKKKNKD